MSWLKPYLRTWYKAYPDSIPPTRMIAHYVKPLLKAHPEERVVAELAAYLRQTPSQFVSLPRFVSTFGTWNKPEPKTYRPHSQTADEMDRKAGILP
jgi:hypothetical protein